MRKLRLYVTEAQYRLLEQRAGERRSIAAVVRDLIDGDRDPEDPELDRFYRHLITEKDGSGSVYRAEHAKRKLYRPPH